MTSTILVTGGAGFIGSHLTDALLARGYRVRVLDNLTEQVHGPGAHPPEYLNSDCELRVGDVRDRETVTQALRGVDAVFHLAATVGVGQSMYEMARYTSVNNVGTAVLLDALTDQPVSRLLVASSMSLYGEGAYTRRDGGLCHTARRDVRQLRMGQWEPRDAAEHRLEPIPTPEDKAPAFSSIYALSKHDQEQMALIAGRAYGIPALGLRFFNVYGPRQALSNPYTGVLAIFASRLLNGQPPFIFEDGRQLRDFVNIHDVTRACIRALEAPEGAGQVFNIGSGQPYPVLAVARQLARHLGREDLEPIITHKHRLGDIRHCFADISKARRLLGYQPRVSLSTGLDELVRWLKAQTPADNAHRAQQQLHAKGLTL